MNRGGARCHGGAGSAVEIPVSAECRIATRSRLSMAVCGYLLLVYTSSPPAEKQDHMRVARDLVCTRHVSQGGGRLLVLPAADRKWPPETCDSLTLARLCLRCCSTLWA